MSKARADEKTVAQDAAKGALELTFPVSSFRKLPNPYEKLPIGDHHPTAYMMYVDVKDLPDNIPMQTNPRKQKLTTAVAKKIRSSLVRNDLNFYLENRGLLISAQSCTFNNYTGEATIVFSDLTVHGDVDGGHTYEIIKESRDGLEPKTQFVKLEVIEGCESFFTDLAAARNTSIQVKDQSIAELESKFDIIKTGIHEMPFYKDVYFEENDEGDINVADILAILNMFDLDHFPDVNALPKNSYTSRNTCIQRYLKLYDQHNGSNGNPRDNPYVKMLPIMQDIFRLYDKIECNVGVYYKESTNGSGRYGATKGVTTAKDADHLFKARFSDTKIWHSTPTGFLYPIVGSLRADMMKAPNGDYCWRYDPFELVDELGPELVSTTVERSRTLGGNPNAVGKDAGNWKTLYMTVMMRVMDKMMGNQA